MSYFWPNLLTHTELWIQPDRLHTGYAMEDDFWCHWLQEYIQNPAFLSENPVQIFFYYLQNIGNPVQIFLCSF